MTAPTQGKDTAAAVGFVGFMALVLGPVGVVLAAVAVGAERAWSRRTVGESPTDRVAADREWLAHDASQRAAYRRARQEWWAAGADPATKPAEPSRASRLGAWFRRQRARDRVWSEDFLAGFREGRRAAEQVRRDGGGFRDIVRARPARPAWESDEVPVDPWEEHSTPVADPPESPQPEPAAAASPDDPGRQADPLNLAGREDEPGAQTEPDDATDQQASSTDNGGTDMATVTSDSNAAVLRTKLTGIGATTSQVSDLVDQLAAVREQLASQVADAAEFAEATGQTAVTRTALDSASAVSAQLSQHLGAASEAADRAAEDTALAGGGLRPVEQAEDALAQAGADGRAVAPATAA